VAKKKSQVEKAIESLEGEIAVLRLAIDKLKQQQSRTPVKRPRAVEAKAAS
jgi:hypothetical protein